jgi:alkylation response protein AidB-like acyl-CoA dehydrogenase
LIDGKVVTPPGWKEAYQQFAAGGWGALAAPEEWGGQNLPQVIATAAGEVWNSSNLAFGLCPLLTFGAIDAIEAQGTDELKRLYLPKMVSGEWTGHDEPHRAARGLGPECAQEPRGQAGRRQLPHLRHQDLHHLRRPRDDRQHRASCARRLPDAPPGTRGISLFLVPKYLVNKDGSIGARNDVTCASLEHKLGIHASPTAVMKYGEKDGAVGYLVGEENRGLNVMFIMMNAARLAVGMQGVAVAERRPSSALAYAKERRQGRSMSAKSAA